VPVRSRNFQRECFEAYSWKVRLERLLNVSFTSAGFIFIDARHDYESVREDFQVWAPKLAPDGAMAFHDSRVCPARPDIEESSGPVRLMREIGSGVHGPWQIVATADSVTVI
jgi:Methyltransferase domain